MLFAFSNVLFVAMATRLIIFKEFSFFNHVILELLMSLMLLTSSIRIQKVLKKGLTKQRKERSFRERKIFIRKEHFITLLPVLNNF